MNKQDLQQRANEITVQMENVKQQFVTLQAHLNECNFWLTKCNELEAQVEAEKAQMETANGEPQEDSVASEEAPAE